MRPLSLWCDAFPVVSETFVREEARALAALGHPVEIVASVRASHPAAGAADLRARFLSDDGPLTRAVAMVVVGLRHPTGCARDIAARRRWRREEPVAPLRELAPEVLRLARRPDARIHAHFAAGAALNALRVSRLLGRPFSLTAHAFDIYQQPRNLREKLRAADVVTSGCAYTVADLRSLAGPRHAARVHEIVMGVDPVRLTRRTPHGSGRTVVAVGRLVEKKGFAVLARAAAHPALAGRLERLVVVGDGPLHDALAAEAQALGLGAVVTLAGRRDPDEIRALLEEADVLAMPCVIAADGDRDSMPVVVKEAMAMEVPVVVSDLVGLPELVGPDAGKIVAPGDVDALATALAAMLDLAPDARAAMGRAGRDRVLERADVRAETAKLSALLVDNEHSAGPTA